MTADQAAKKVTPAITAPTAAIVGRAYPCLRRRHPHHRQHPLRYYHRPFFARTAALTHNLAFPS